MPPPMPLGICEPLSGGMDGRWVDSSSSLLEQYYLTSGRSGKRLKSTYFDLSYFCPRSKKRDLSHNENQFNVFEI